MALNVKHSTAEAGKYHNVIKIIKTQLLHTKPLVVVTALVLGGHQSPGTDPPEEEISVVFCKFPAHSGHVEGPEEGMGLSRVEELEICLHRPVGVAGVAGLQLRHGLVLEVNWK